MNEELKAWIVIFGDPIDGFMFYGPFEGQQKASEWAESQAASDWWIAPIEAVES